MTKAYEDFLSQYQNEAKEILVLISDSNGAATGSSGGYWTCIKYFLAYVDVSSNELKKGEGCVAWPLTKEELDEKGFAYPYFFKNGGIYRLLARKLNDEAVFDKTAPVCNRFLVSEVLAEDVPNDELLAILEEYRVPVIISDGLLGEFKLDKDLSIFEGEIEWLGERVYVSLEVDEHDKQSCEKALETLRALFENQTKRDAELRAFAAERLVVGANEWQQEENAPEISEQEFIGRIGLSELSVSAEGDYTAYYLDGDMFFGHIIMVDGNIDSGLEDAYIAG
jgi:hypothetical protein